jgi:hypothetical protein
MKCRVDCRADERQSRVRSGTYEAGMNIAHALEQSPDFEGVCMCEWVPGMDYTGAVYQNGR